jgi:hypothetical protein
MLRNQQARATALQDELQALEQDLAMSSREEQYAFELLAQMECKSICNRVMVQLPRELRDMVYHHLSTDSEEHISREYFRSTMDPTTKLFTYDTARWKADQYPENFWDTAYVGNDFFQDLAESYYRTSVFVFSDDGGLIERFLEVDQLRLGYAPKELVTKVEVHLSAMTHDRSSCVGYMFGCATKSERLEAALVGIEQLKVVADICVHFSTQAKDEKQKKEQIETVCNALIPKLREAKLAGHRARLVIDRKMEIGLDDMVGCYQLKQGGHASEDVVKVVS